MGWSRAFIGAEPPLLAGLCPPLCGCCLAVMGVGEGRGRVELVCRVSGSGMRLLPRGRAAGSIPSARVHCCQAVGGAGQQGHSRPRSEKVPTGQVSGQPRDPLASRRQHLLAGVWPGAGSLCLWRRGHKACRALSGLWVPFHPPPARSPILPRRIAGDARLLLLARPASGCSCGGDRGRVQCVSRALLVRPVGGGLAVPACPAPLPLPSAGGERPPCQAPGRVAAGRGHL